MYHRVKHGRPQGVLQELKWWVKGERKDYYSSSFSDTHISLGTNDFHNHGKCTLFCWPVLCSYFSNICYRFGEKQSIFLCSVELYEDNLISTLCFAIWQQWHGIQIKACLGFSFLYFLDFSNFACKIICMNKCCLRRKLWNFCKQQSSVKRHDNHESLLGSFHSTNMQALPIFFC